MVPKVGVEPTRACAHTALNRARLPVSPLRHMDLCFHLRWQNISKRPALVKDGSGYLNQGGKRLNPSFFLARLAFNTMIHPGK